MSTSSTTALPLPSVKRVVAAIGFASVATAGSFVVLPQLSREIAPPFKLGVSLLNGIAVLRAVAGPSLLSLPLRSMVSLVPVLVGAGAVAGYFIVREQVRQSCPMSNEELRECRDWFEGTARKMGALEWDQVMGSGRLMFIAFARGDKFIYPEDLQAGRFSEHGTSAKIAFLCAQINTKPEALANMVRSISKVADRNNDGKISSTEFLMVWMVFCHFMMETVGGDSGGTDTLVRHRKILC